MRIAILCDPRLQLPFLDPFYQKCGYEEEARIREYYQAGEDKVVFRKLLTVSISENY